MTAITWKTGKSGNWNLGSGWSTGGVPGAGDDATINASGTYTVTLNDAESVHSLTLAAAGAHVTDASGGTLTLGGALSITAGTFTLAGGEIVGGTISAAGGSFVASSGTLASLTYQGTLAAGSGLTLDGAIGFTGAGGTGAGVLNLNAAGSSFYMQDSTSLDNATVNLGTSDTIYLQGNLSNDETLTLGAHLNLVQATSGSHDGVNMYAYVGNTATFVNHGTITASAAKGSLEFYGAPGTITNAGTIAISNGDTVQIDADVVFANTGTVTIGTGSTLTLGGTETTAGLGAIANSGTLSLAGTLSNTGATYTVGSTGVTSLSGTIVGGTVIDANGSLVAAGGTLSGVSYDGTLNVGSGGSVFLTGNDSFAGATGTGGGVINLPGTGTSGVLYAEDSTTLDNAMLNLHGGGQINLYSNLSNDDTLTLGTHFTLLQTGNAANNTINLYSDTGNSGTLVNNGTISAAANKGNFTIYGSQGDAFINAGTLAVSNGDVTYISGIAFSNTGSISIAAASTLALNGTETTANLGVITNAGTLSLGGSDTLTNSGATFTVPSGAGVTSLAGTILGGTVVDTAGALLGAGGTLSGVTYDGTLSLAANGSAFTIGAGDSFTGANGTGAGTINLTGSGAALYTPDNTTLDNLTLTMGGGSAIYLESVNSNDDTLTFGSQFNLQHVTAGASSTISLYNGVSNSGTVINLGTINAAAKNGVLYFNGAGGLSTFLTTVINAGNITISNGDDVYMNGVSFTNTGSIGISAASTLNLAGTETTAGLGNISNAGTLQIGGTLTNTGATLTLGTGSVLGSLYLTGTIAGGTIVDASGTGLAKGGSGTLAGVTYDGTLSVGNSEYLLASGGLTIAGANGTGAGTINVADRLDIQGGITGTGTINDTGNVFVYDNTTLTGLTINLAGGGLLTDAVNVAKSTLFLNASTSVNFTGNSLLYAEDSGDTIVNAGLISGAGKNNTLQVANQGTFTNYGELSATGSATINFASGKLSNLSAGTLTGGIWDAETGGVIQLYQNSNVSTLACNLILSGAGSALQWTNSTSGKTVAIDTNLTTIAAGGALRLMAGRNLTTTGTITDNGALVLGGGTFKAGALAISAGGSLVGTGTLATPLADAGRVDAAGGTLLVSGAITGAGMLLADTGATLEIAGTTSASETFGFFGQGGVLKLDNAAGFASPITGYAAGDIISLGTLTATSASISGTVLSVGLGSGSTLSFALSGGATNEHAGISADGHSLTAYRFAAPSLHTPEPLAFGNHHVGDTASATLTLTNTAAADGFSEKLDATLSGGSAGVAASGSFTGLAAGATDNTDLVAGLNTAAAGSVAGTATVSLSTDGTGVDGFGATSLGSQTVNVTGAVYNYAAGGLANGGTLALGNVHVAAQASGALTLTNTGAAGNYTEALDATLGGASAGLSASGSVTGLAAGATDASSLQIGYTAGAAGAFSASATLGLTSDGNGIDGLGATALGSQAVVVTGAAYNYAAGQIASTTINLGVVHVGSAGAALGISNIAASGNFSEALDAGIGGATGAAGVSGSITGLAAGSASNGLTLSLTSNASGTYSGSATVTFTSDGAGIDGLGTTGLGTQTVTETAVFDNYAVAALQASGGPAITGSGTNFTLNLGTVAQNSNTLTETLGVLNAAGGLADLLGGTITASGGTGFTNTGFGTFSGLGAGQGEQSQTISLSTSTAGTFTETIVLTSAGSNASGYNGALAMQTLTITGTVAVPTSGPTTYMLATGPNTITGADGGDLFQATASSLNSRDQITGGNGANMLQLLGGGVFDLGAPKVLANIQTVTASEGQAAFKTSPDSRQTIYLRDGVNEMLNVTAGMAASGNTNAEAITVYDGTGNDTIRLAAGQDRVVLYTGTDNVILGGAANSVVAGGGTALVQATAAFAGASVVGTSGGTTTLEITNAGTATLNAADTYLTVNLDGATKLTLGGMGFITANGGNGGDTLIAGAGNQTLIGGAADVLTGFSGGSDIFLGSSAALNNDTVGKWASGDVLDLTDMNSATLQALAYKAGKTSGVLTVKDGTHSSAITFTGSYASTNFVVLGSDGHGGTFIGFHG